VLFIQHGKIQALLPWQEGERYLHPQRAISTCAGSCCCPVLSMPTHYPQTEMIGAFGEQLLEWLTTYTFRWRASLPMKTTPQRSRSSLSTSC
jgi:guanine deaminase